MSTTALVIAGAVAKGAFQAGVLKVLADNEIAVSAVVGASAGALNAVVYAAGIRQNRLKVICAELVDVWKTRAKATVVFDPSVRDAVALRGLSTMEHGRELLRDVLGGDNTYHGASGSVAGRLILTPIAGETKKIGDLEHTTFETQHEFHGNDFDHEGPREKIISAALASSAFPGAFVPVQAADHGLCIDGGTVNNTPIGHAVDLLPTLTRVIVVVAQPRLMKGPAEFSGTALVTHLADILVNERLFRDLSEAQRTNDQLRALAAFRRQHLNGDQYAELLAALGWSKRRTIDVVEIRPDKDLPGTSFDGFFHSDLRERYIALGAEAATAQLGRLKSLPLPDMASSEVVSPSGVQS